MFGTFARRVTMASAVMLASSAAAEAQWFPGAACGGCATAAAPVIAPPVAMVNPCPCVQAVPQTVYREVPVTTYKPVQKTVQRPVVRTTYEDRPVTAYRQVMETKTVEVPTTAYQTVTECQQVTSNQSYWQTAYQPVPKMTPCQYDPNPTLLGAINRNMYSMRMAFTPNYIRQRQFVPNIVAHNVPVTRTVAVPTTRQVTYNVAKLEPYETTQRVAVLKTEMQDVEVTAYEPVTEMRTVAVGVSTQYAYVDPFLGGTATAIAPIPDRTRSASKEPTPATSQRDDSPFKLNSYPSPKSEPTPAKTLEPTPEAPGYYDARVREAAKPADVPTQLVSSTGWRAARRTTIDSVPATPEPTGRSPLSDVSVAAR